MVCNSTLQEKIGLGHGYYSKLLSSFSRSPGLPILYTAVLHCRVQFLPIVVLLWIEELVYTSTFINARAIAIIMVVFNQGTLKLHGILHILCHYACVAVSFYRVLTLPCDC